MVGGVVEKFIVETNVTIHLLKETKSLISRSTIS